jgi:hypothetical protein
VVAADELQPIFVYALAQARFSELRALAAGLEALASPALLAGEAGYYLVLLHSAIAFCQQVDLERFSAA